MSFPVSEKIDAFTNKTTAQVEKWLGSDNEYFVLVDTPGLSVCLSVCLSVYYYRPQTKFAKVMFLQASVCPWGGGWHVWLLGGMCGRGLCMVGGACMVRGGACVAGGACMAGGMCGQGACMVWGACMVGGACIVRGACMAGGMHGRGACIAGGHAWQGGMCGQGVYMAGGVHSRRCAWLGGMCG